MRKFLWNWLLAAAALAGIILGVAGFAVFVSAAFGVFGFPIALAAWFALVSFIWACLIPS